MAFNQIPIANTPWGQQLLAYRQQLIAYRQMQSSLKVLGANILAKIASMIDNAADPVSYAQIESQLSLQTGQGATLYNQLNSVVGNIANTDSTASVNAAIDQFDGWIG